MSRSTLKSLVLRTPFALAARLATAMIGRYSFKSSDSYWEQRYKNGGTSGAGSYGRLAKYKAEVLNAFVKERGVKSVIEFGSGDGNQLILAEYPKYTGVDVAETAVRACRARFAGQDEKTFMSVAEYDGSRAELALSLDVIYHLVEDAVFEQYIRALFDAAVRFVIIYASNKDEQPVEKHVRHRKFTDWVSKNRTDFRLIDHQPNRYPFNPSDPDNTSFSEIYIFEIKN